MGKYIQKIWKKICKGYKGLISWLLNQLPLLYFLVKAQFYITLYTAAMCVQFILQGIDRAWHCNLCPSMDRHCHFNRLRLSLYNSGPDPISGSRYISLADNSVNFSSILSLSKNILWRAIPSWPSIRWPN